MRKCAVPPPASASRSIVRNSDSPGAAPCPAHLGRTPVSRLLVGGQQSEAGSCPPSPLSPFLPRGQQDPPPPAGDASHGGAPRISAAAANKLSRLPSGCPHAETTRVAEGPMSGPFLELPPAWTVSPEARLTAVAARLSAQRGLSLAMI
ncbi:hypothetical protein P7K49_002205 [Saguinus oedipus]|uniref:Uncharacterized protein n=1 Tax=Saguinus oedipus TaxID=9490 RepID=A0ABQ9WIN6_SAGOE|nr:hypothetical protein P7K49_002205 [Saguinus oedipus]